MRRALGSAAFVAAALLAQGCGQVHPQAGTQEASPSPGTPAAAARPASPAPTPDVTTLGATAPEDPSSGRLSSSHPSNEELTADGGPRSSASATARAQAPGAAATTLTQAGGPSADETEPREPRPLTLGSKGSRVRGLQEELRALRYDPGPVDGVFGATTQAAVWAFQKVNHLHPDGVVGPKTMRALEHPRPPRPLVRHGADDRVEIDLTHQLLYVYAGDELRLISHISSGSGVPYCSNGHCGDAVTPTGDYHTTWRVDGWRTSYLGHLYNPVYFVDGIAVHGYPNVPLHPASHGCVRIPMHTAEIFPKIVGEDEAVYVRR